MPAACSEQADAHCGVRERKSPKDLSTFGVPRRGGRCVSERPNKRLRPLDLHIDAAANNAMLVNFNAQQASASQVHGMKNRHIGAGRAFSRPSRHPSSAPTRAAMRMFRFRKPEMRRISSSLSEKSNRRYFPRCAVPRAPAAPAATTGYCMSQRKQICAWLLPRALLDECRRGPMSCHSRVARFKILGRGQRTTVGQEGALSRQNALLNGSS